MNKAHYNLILFLITFALFICPIEIGAQDATRIDVRKPHIYLSFERKGERKPVSVTESSNNIWLRFNNNSKWLVKVCVHSLFPVRHNTKTLDGRTLLTLQNGSEVRLCYGVETYFSYKSTVSKTLGKNRLRGTKDKQDCPLNFYNDGNYGGEAWVPSGNSVVFSVPAEYLTESHAIYIKYSYEWDESEYSDEYRTPEHRVYFADFQLK